MKIQTDSGWETLKAKDGTNVWHLSAYSIPLNESTEWKLNWSSMYGELDPGTYRLCKPIWEGLFTQDGQHYVYSVEFTIGIVDEDITLLEIVPNLYSSEQAMLDGCLVIQNGDVMHNQDVFCSFVESSRNGENCSVRIADYFDTEAGTKHIIYDLRYDGSDYILEWIENGEKVTKSFQFMMHYAGEKECADVAYDAYDRYVLTNDSSITWGRIRENTCSDYHVVYSDTIYYPEYAEIPADLERATLEYNGQQYATVTDVDSLTGIYELFASAEILAYEPKTHSIGIGLNLVLFSGSDEQLIIELDPDMDTCRINGQYVFYGAYDEPEYIDKLWKYLGITGWPENLNDK